MASITITQVQLQTKFENGLPTNQYWTPFTEKEASINPDNIVAVAYVYDIYLNHYIPGIIQIILAGALGPIYSSDSYASIVAYMNPILP
jgi:hypothetical protein